MRTTPFTAEELGKAPAAAAPAAEQTAAPKTVQSIDLLSRLRQPAQLNNSAAQPANNKSTARGIPPNGPATTEGETTEGEETKPEGETTEGAQEPTVANPTATFEEFEQQTEKKLKDFVENPEEVALMMARYYNIGRSFIAPMLYTKLIFPGRESEDVKLVADKAIENEKKEGTAVTEGFNPYEKRLFAKWQKREQLMPGTSFSEEDIKFLARSFAKYVGEMGVAVWMEKYSWLVALVFLELKYAAPFIALRVSDSFEKKAGA